MVAYNIGPSHSPKLAQKRRYLAALQGAAREHVFARSALECETVVSPCPFNYFNDSTATSLSLNARLHSAASSSSP